MTEIGVCCLFALKAQSMDDGRLPNNAHAMDYLLITWSL